MTATAHASDVLQYTLPRTQLMQIPYDGVYGTHFVVNALASLERRAQDASAVIPPQEFMLPLCLIAVMAIRGREESGSDIIDRMKAAGAVFVGVAFGDSIPGEMQRRQASAFLAGTSPFLTLQLTARRSSPPILVSAILSATHQPAPGHLPVLRWNNDNDCLLRSRLLYAITTEPKEYWEQDYQTWYNTGRSY